MHSLTKELCFDLPLIVGSQTGTVRHENTTIVMKCNRKSDCQFKLGEKLRILYIPTISLKLPGFFRLVDTNISCLAELKAYLIIQSL